METNVNKLIEALRPFAKEADKWLQFDDEEHLVESWYGVPDSILTVGHLRAAKQAIEDFLRAGEASRRD